MPVVMSPSAGGNASGENPTAVTVSERTLLSPLERRKSESHTESITDQHGNSVSYRARQDCLGVYPIESQKSPRMEFAEAF